MRGEDPFRDKGAGNCLRSSPFEDVQCTPCHGRHENSACSTATSNDSSNWWEKGMDDSPAHGDHCHGGKCQSYSQQRGKQRGWDRTLGSWRGRRAKLRLMSCKALSAHMASSSGPKTMMQAEARWRGRRWRNERTSSGEGDE